MLFILSGATISNRYRLNQFHQLQTQSTDIVDNIIVQQQSKIDELRKEFQQSSSLSKTIIEEIHSFHQNSLEQQHGDQMKLISQMSLVLVSTSFLTLFVTWLINHK